MVPKYPKTLYWPTSPSVDRQDKLVDDPTRFLGLPVVITEKLDGGCTAIHQGNVYARSTFSPTVHPSFELIKKYHAWKTTETPHIVLYGENLYGVHSIEYDAMRPEQTFRLFAVRYINPDVEEHNDRKEWFADWQLVERHAGFLGIRTVPVVYEGKFQTVDQINTKFEELMNRPQLGKSCEGFVMRTENVFAACDFSEKVCKYVRANHVQTDEHWTRNWKKCKLVR